MTTAITSNELRERIASDTPPRILDVRTPAEFESSHIDGSLNVPLDVLNEHGPKVAERLDQSDDLVLVCRSGQRATQAQELLQRAGVDGGSVLEKGISDWERQGY
jgi:rhodanese-related sulfurtransferase